ncbi:MAG: hypothetical protein F7B17_08140 [Desulfurococcales archaeon]|nr:hypothetical protein [Desulfurococcales archaeon]
MAARFIALYLRLYFALKSWRISSRLRFRVKVRSLPQGLAEDLIREYDGALSKLGLPSPLGAGRLASRRSWRRVFKGGGGG